MSQRPRPVIGISVASDVIDGLRAVALLRHRGVKSHRLINRAACRVLKKRRRLAPGACEASSLHVAHRRAITAFTTGGGQ